jgi:hypothetical protein
VSDQLVAGALGEHKQEGLEETAHGGRVPLDFSESGRVTDFLYRAGTAIEEVN